MRSRAKILTTTLTTVAALLFVLVPVSAQQSEKIYRIGYLSNRYKVEYREEALRDGLRELGYVEGKNLIIEWRFAKGQRQQLPEFASELVHMGVNCIVASGLGATRAAKKATSEVPIPVVMANIFDPVRTGIVSSLARPEGNITGFTTMSIGVTDKLIDLLKDAFPSLSRLTLLLEKNHPNNPRAIEETQIAAQKLGVQVQILEVGPDDLERAFHAARAGQSDAINVRGTGLMHRNLAKIIRLEAETKLPVIYTERRFVDAGGLMSYGLDRADPYHRAAAYLDRIFKGAKPRDLPVQQPRKFDFVINLQTAKAAGINFPRSTLLRANEVID